MQSSYVCTKLLTSEEAAGCEIRATAPIPGCRRKVSWRPDWVAGAGGFEPRHRWRCPHAHSDNNDSRQPGALLAPDLVAAPRQNNRHLPRPVKRRLQILPILFVGLAKDVAISASARPSPADMMARASSSLLTGGSIGHLRNRGVQAFGQILPVLAVLFAVRLLHRETG